MFMAPESIVTEIEAARQILFSKKPIGRPRLNPPGHRYATWRLKTPSGFPLVCRRHGCNKRLRKNDVLVCSPACQEDLTNFCESVLKVFSGELPEEAFPIYFRSARLRTLKRRTTA